MIHEVDEALHGLLTAEVLGPAGVEVAFDAPTRDWAARRNAPAVNLFLYDLRESLAHRQQGRRPEYKADGTTVAVHEPPRWFELSYLVTAWTTRPQDEHRLLATLLTGLMARPSLPAEHLTGSLAALGLTVPCTIARPPGEGRALADVWSALGGELKPSLDLVVTAPLSAAPRPVGPPVTDGLLVRTSDRTDDRTRSELRRARYEGDALEATVGVRRVRGTVSRRARPEQAPG
ncbi:DUF4255 domain-containing protein [Streptomyces sp. NPDC054770]